VLKTFMDETGTHDDATMVAVAGYIARPKHWRAWTKDWNRAKRPIKVFHSTDCANFHGEFAGWEKERRDRYVAQLLPVMPAHELAGIVIGVRLDDLAMVWISLARLSEMTLRLCAGVSCGQGFALMLCCTFAIDNLLAAGGCHGRQ
jgi:hypothetical protein